MFLSNSTSSLLSQIVMYEKFKNFSSFTSSNILLEIFDPSSFYNLIAFNRLQLITLMFFFVYLVYVIHNLKFHNKCLIFIVKMRHVPHPSETKFHVFEFVIDMSIFFLKLVLSSEAHTSPLSNKILCLNLCFWGETRASPYLIYLNFTLNLCLEVRHMPHLYQTKFYVLNLYF